MPSDSSSTNVPFKDWFGASRYHRIAEKLAGAEPRFDRELFLRIALEGLAERELMARLRQTSVAADAALPGSFSDKVAVLRKIAAPESNSFVGIWYADFVGQYGTNHTKKALAALRYFTRFGSAELAIREFILQDPEFTLAEMIRWSTDQNEHVRRLASEGSRPRLPWGKQLGSLVADPRPTREILDNLCEDESLYVRKSVANHLNDISKDHPDYVLEVVNSWDQRNPHVAWITKHALRTLIKKADPATLDFHGIRPSAETRRGDAFTAPAASKTRRPPDFIAGDIITRFDRAISANRLRGALCKGLGWDQPKGLQMEGNHARFKILADIKETTTHPRFQHAETLCREPSS